MIILISIIAAVVTGIVAARLSKVFKKADIDSPKETLALVGATTFQVIAMLFGALSIFFSAAYICVHNEYLCEQKRIELNEQRVSLVFFIENSGTGAVAFADSVADFNAKIVNGRRALDNSWLKDVTYSVYDEIEPIDLQEYIDYDNGVLV